jgi:predicted DNA-binding transcriptional regulator AlpA
MIEDDIRALTHEIRLLREAIQSQPGLAQPPQSRHHSTAHDPSPPLPDVINERTATELIGMSVAMLHRWRAAKEGPPFFKIGRAVRYSRAKIQEWLDRQPGFNPGGAVPVPPAERQRPRRG